MIYFITVTLLSMSVPSIYGYVEMVPGHNYSRSSSHNSLLEIYCYSGLPKSIHRIWETVNLQLSLSEGFDQFDGSTPEEVENKFKEQISSWNILSNFYSWRRRTVRLNPFERSCIGIHTHHGYSVQLIRTRVDFWKVLYLVGGLSLFLWSPSLAKNQAFYYITGTSVGSFALLLLLLFMFSRLFPRKAVMYSILAGGWSVCFYMAQLLWDNLRVVLTDYSTYFLSCIALTSLISFILCYRFGPVSDPRTVNLIQWTLQFLALCFIFISTEFREASIAFLIIFLSFYNTPPWLFYRVSELCRRSWYRAEPRRLLSEEEFHRQSVVETDKALHGLRQFCSSPQCDQWRTILKLHDPTRFAKFVRGGSHLNDEEVLAFETSHNKNLDSDETSDDSLTD